MAHQADDEEEYGGPAARYSEFIPGQLVTYQLGGQLATGWLLYLSDGEGGQLAIVENRATGFPDVVPARELSPGA